MSNPDNPAPYPARGSDPWDGSLQAYVDGGDLAAVWQALTFYAAAAVVLAPDGSMISRTAPGTSRATFDPTEAAQWTAVLATSGTIEQVALAGAIAAGGGGSTAPGLIAYAENNSGQPTVGVSGTAIPILGCVVIVPPTNYDVWLEWQCALAITTPGQGSVSVSVTEVTGGVLGTTVNDGTNHSFFSNGVIEPYGPTLSGSVRVGPMTTQRVFAFGISLTPASSALAVSAINGYAGPYGRLFKSWIAAVAK